MPKTKADKELDKAIEKAYYRLAAGRQIPLTRICKMWDEARTAIKAGHNLEDIMTELVILYTKEA